MAIRYDRARFTIVVVCDCGWQDLGITKEAAWSLAADHETRAHPDQRTVRNAASHRAGHAQKNSDPESENLPT